MTRRSSQPSMLTAHLKIPVGERSLEAEITVPRGEARPTQLLPVLQSLSNSLVTRAVEDSEAEGLGISCQKGCGACCRQAVPISEIEAHHVNALLDSLPEPRRSLVRSRFVEAAQRLEEAGLLTRMRAPERLSGPERLELGLAYFRVGIACPFLEDESCSIHPDRPVACREYLVTSPASHCAQPTGETVRLVPMPVKVSLALFRSGRDSGAGDLHWVPLILAPTWAEARDEPGARPAPQILEEVLKNLKRTSALTA